jgi:F-box interacting protein
MSDHIPFEIQSEIMKRLPVKSLLQFRSVSKQWKSFINSPEFIKNYHINHPNPQHHLLVQNNEIDTIQTYTSIIDDNTFPKQKFSLTVPEPLNLLGFAVSLGSVNGLLCFYGDVDSKEMAVIWNPSVRKYVGIVIPNVLYSRVGYTRIGFGVCPDTNDPNLVKINIVRTPSKCWEVQVFTLSSRVWKTVYMGAPKSVGLNWNHVSVDGVIYWHSYDNFIISFDLKSEKFGEVCLPERLVITSVEVVKVHESLGLLEYYYEGEMSVCGVWMRKDGVNKPFTKIYTINFEGKSFNRVLGFRNNGEVVMEMADDDSKKSQIEVYEPLSGRFNNVGISGKHHKFTVSSYAETLLLLDESNSIIH